MIDSFENREEDLQRIKPVIVEKMIKTSNSMSIRDATGRYYELLDKIEINKEEGIIDDFVSACRESLLYLDSMIIWDKMSITGTNPSLVTKVVDNGYSNVTDYLFDVIRKKTKINGNTDYYSEKPVTIRTSDGLQAISKSVFRIRTIPCLEELGDYYAITNNEDGLNELKEIITYYKG